MTPELAFPRLSVTDRPVIGLALGSGAARGWSHLGVIKALAEQSIHPDVVCGCSIGAVVGAALVSGKARELEEWVCSLDWQGVVAMLDISLRGGLIRGDRVVQYCAQHFFAEDFANLSIPFACVATDLANGREVWLREGRIADAVKASIAMPGLFSPVVYRGRTLADGGLVNPVPVSLCRAMGADVVIAVELSAGMVGRPFKRTVQREAQSAGWSQRLFGMLSRVPTTPSSEDVDGPAPPTLSFQEVIASSVNIMQMRIARSRLAGEPADVVISPRTSHIGILEFDRAAEAIAEGEAVVARMPQIREALGLDDES